MTKIRYLSFDTSSRLLIKNFTERTVFGVQLRNLYIKHMHKYNETDFTQYADDKIILMGI